jgi:hypothetical protein
MVRESVARTVLAGAIALEPISRVAMRVMRRRHAVWVRAL